jgi:hypothetical protein
LNPLNKQALIIDEEHTRISVSKSDDGDCDRFHCVAQISNHSGYKITLDEMELEWIGPADPVLTIRNKYLGEVLDNRAEKRRYFFGKYLNHSEVSEIKRSVRYSASSIRIRVTVYFRSVFGEDKVILSFSPRTKPYEL